MQFFRIAQNMTGKVKVNLVLATLLRAALWSRKDPSDLFGQSDPSRHFSVNDIYSPNQKQFRSEFLSCQRMDVVGKDW